MRAPVRPSSKRLWCLVLAAGGSSRLGRPKQFIRHKGRSLLLRAVTVAENTTPGRTVVVLGAHVLRSRLALRRSPVCPISIYNGRWREGLSSSLHAGLTALPQTASAALVMLCDQPRIDTAAIARLVLTWQMQPAHAAAAVYAGRVGVPAILPRKLWRQASRLRGDVGARTLLNELPRLARVPMPQALFDVDTPKDVDKL
jgi:molybdenum cofactor cytidylyltransferase